MAGSISSQPMVPGSDIWPGYWRVANAAVSSSSVMLSHQLTAVNVDLQWQLDCHANINDSAIAAAEVVYELASPYPQVGNLVVEWLPALQGTGQASLQVDLYDDGVVDAVSSATIPTAFGQTPLIMRVHVQTAAHAGSFQGPWGSSWTWSGAAGGDLRIRFVPTHSTSLAAVMQPCSSGVGLQAQSNLNQGVQLQAQCAVADDLALFVLGFQTADLPLPLSSTCRLLVDELVVIGQQLIVGSIAEHSIAVPLAVRPAFFYAQAVALDVDLMSLTASDSVRTDVQ
jgi:hypothetical protein